MRLIALLQENISLFSNIEEFHERVYPLSIERKWVEDIALNVSKINHFNAEELLIPLDKLIKIQKSTHIITSDFFDNYKYLLTRYSSIDDRNILEDGLVYYNIEFNFFNRIYLIELKIDQAIESIKAKNSQEAIIKKQEFLTTHKYQFNIYKGSKLLIMQKNDKNDDFLETLEFLIETDHILLENLWENNPALNDYRIKRELIPQILTRCKTDNLLKPVTKESLNVYVKLMNK